MKIFVHARPSSREAKIEKVDITNFVVSVKEPPVRGQANHAIIKALAAYFSRPLSCIRIIRGQFSKEKVIEISE